MTALMGRECLRDEIIKQLVCTDDAVCFYVKTGGVHQTGMHHPSTLFLTASVLGVLSMTKTRRTLAGTERNGNAASTGLSGNFKNESPQRETK